MVISEKVEAVLTAQPIKSFTVQPLQIILKSYIMTIIKYTLSIGTRSSLSLKDNYMAIQ